jgi:hypothetical protein
MVLRSDSTMTRTAKQNGARRPNTSACKTESDVCGDPSSVRATTRTSNEWELEERYVSALVKFFQLLDKWDREARIDAEDM